MHAFTPERCGVPLFILASLCACVGQGELPGPPYELVVLDRVEDGEEFALRRGQLTTVEDFDELASPFYRIRQGGVLTTEEVHGDTVTSGTFTGGEPPALRYVVEQGVAVPRDYATLSMFSAAYHFETVLAQLDNLLTPSVSAAMEARGPVDVLIGPVMRLRVAGVDVSLRQSMNAFFFAEGWQFGLAETSESERAPLASDARVIAHELGHAVFQMAFAGGPAEPCDAARKDANLADPWFVGRMEEELVIGGVNEGLADWLSFVVTGSTSALENLQGTSSPAIEDLVAQRQLTEDNFLWQDIAKLDTPAAALDACRGKYCLGTLLARSLVAAYQAAGHALDDADARVRYSRDVVSSLEGTLARMRERGLAAPSPEVAACELREDVSSAQDPPILGAFLRAFLLGFGEADRALLCRELEARFGEGFPAEFREECAP